MSINFEHIESLVTLAQQGDKKSIHALYKNTHPALYGIAMHILKNHEDAQDAAQDSFILIIGGLSNIPSKKYFIPWAKRICTNHCLHMISSRKEVAVDNITYIADQHFDASPDMLNTYLQHESLDLIKLALSELHPAIALTMELKYLKGYKVREISEIVDAPIGTIKSRIHQGKRGLVKILETDSRFTSIRSVLLPITLLTTVPTPLGRSSNSTKNISQSPVSAIGVTCGVMALGVGGASLLSTDSNISTPTIHSTTMDNISPANNLASGTTPILFSADYKDGYLYVVFDEESPSLDYSSIYLSSENGLNIVPEGLNEIDGSIIFQLDPSDTAVTLHASSVDGGTSHNEIFIH